MAVTRAAEIAAANVQAGRELTGGTDVSRFISGMAAMQTNPTLAPILGNRKK